MILLTEDDARPNRDDWPRKDGRVLVDHGGQMVQCYSPSSLPSHLGAGFSAPAWKARNQAKGAGLRPDLAIMASVLDVQADKVELDGLVEQMEEAGGSKAAANRGTAMHSAIRRLLRGMSVEMPDECHPDIEAVLSCLEEWGIALLDRCWDERSLFNPFLPALGQCDALVTSSKLDGVLVLDLKTGSIKPLDCAIQLSCYAGATHEARLVDGAVKLAPLPFLIRTDVGLILHAPWGKGTARIVAVDLIEGDRLARLGVAAHQETLDSGRVVIKDVGSRVVPSTHVEPASGAGGDTGKDADPEQSARANTVTPPAPSLTTLQFGPRSTDGVIDETHYMAKAPAPVMLSVEVSTLSGTTAPSLHARIGDLRRRANVLVEQQIITADDGRTFVIEHAVPPLNMPDSHTPDTVDLWENWITTCEMGLDAGARLPAIMERLQALPVDLYAHVERLAKECEPPVPNLGDDKATGPDLDRLEVILSSVELLHGERIAQVTQALSSRVVSDVADDAALLEWATEDRICPTSGPSVPTLDNLEAERVIALCETYRHDDLPAALRNVGNARDVIAAARHHAQRHQIAPPKSGRDVAADRILAGLVLTHNTESH